MAERSVDYEQMARDLMDVLAVKRDMPPSSRRRLDIPDLQRDQGSRSVEELRQFPGIMVGGSEIEDPEWYDPMPALPGLGALSKAGRQAAGALPGRVVRGHLTGGYGGKASPRAADIPPADILGGRARTLGLPNPYDDQDVLGFWLEQLQGSRLKDSKIQPDDQAKALQEILESLRQSGGVARPNPPGGSRIVKHKGDRTPLTDIPFEELLPRRPGQGDPQLLLGEMLEDYSRVLRGEPSKTLPQAPGVEPPDRLEALDILREHIDRILADMDIPGGGMHRPGASGGLP